MTFRSASLLLALALFAPGSPALAQTAGNAAAGARQFLQCRACHTVGATEAGGVGPNLNGIVGAKAAAKPGYGYSAALAAAKLTWTPATLDAWLKRPSALVPGTKMAFAGMAAPQARADMIAYLLTLKPARR